MPEQYTIPEKKYQTVLKGLAHYAKDKSNKGLWRNELLARAWMEIATDMHGRPLPDIEELTELSIRLTKDVAAIAPGRHKARSVKHGIHPNTKES